MILLLSLKTNSQKHMKRRCSAQKTGAMSVFACVPLEHQFRGGGALNIPWIQTHRACEQIAVVIQDLVQSINHTVSHCQTGKAFCFFCQKKQGWSTLIFPKKRSTYWYMIFNFHQFPLVGYNTCIYLCNYIFSNYITVWWGSVPRCRASPFPCASSSVRLWVRVKQTTQTQKDLW